MVTLLGERHRLFAHPSLVCGYTLSDGSFSHTGATLQFGEEWVCGGRGTGESVLIERGGLG